ncbi:hypothetical protein [Polaromonas sp. JS666]|uniref:hypothetical protein n=1 Tax=Polaromonas sp. (strain JS666 / ATCC BAA-500) TaxID=296591 RepID=UPI0000464B49|nr:hypothetical protein [Polaromonas sp. JS666]ABE45664.1 hypothetical protein Bpro_3765 [Polaromonas sp. JS666]
MRTNVHARAKPRRGGVSENIRLSLDLPFMPILGMGLMLPAFGGFQEISSIFWDYRNPGVLEIYFEEEAMFESDMPTLSAAKAAGWEVDRDH